MKSFNVKANNAVVEIAKNRLCKLKTYECFAQT